MTELVKKKKQNYFDYVVRKKKTIKMLFACILKLIVFTLSFSVLRKSTQKSSLEKLLNFNFPLITETPDCQGVLSLLKNILAYK